MTGETLVQVQIAFCNTQRAKGALDFSHFLSVPFGVHASPRCPEVPETAQRAVPFPPVENRWLGLT